MRLPRTAPALSYPASFAACAVAVAVLAGCRSTADLSALPPTVIPADWDTTQIAQTLHATVARPHACRINGVKEWTRRGALSIEERRLLAWYELRWVDGTLDRHALWWIRAADSMGRTWHIVHLTEPFPGEGWMIADRSGPTDRPMGMKGHACSNRPLRLADAYEMGRYWDERVEKHERVDGLVVPDSIVRGNEGYRVVASGVNPREWAGAFGALPTLVAMD
jgi:hypothetical protein